VAGSRVPVITGIGHEIDESLCDLAADVQAATPSNVAQLLFPDKHELVRHLHFRLVGVKDEIQRAIDEQILRATMLQKDALEQWSSQVRDAINATLSQQKIIAEYDPEMVLRRGYAMISGDLQVGSIVKITTKDIIMKARIESSERRNDN
jgi:exodeoxyribonuclease 7 large subunit